MQAPRETVGRAKVLDTERKHTEKQRIHVTEKRRILNSKGGRETDQVSLFASADTAVPPRPIQPFLHRPIQPFLDGSSDAFLTDARMRDSKAQCSCLFSLIYAEW